ncbi:hypothetical protein Bca4012_077713 [Brassica carinata]
MKQRSMRYYVSQHGEMPTDPINVLPSPAGKQVLVQVHNWNLGLDGLRINSSKRRKNLIAIIMRSQIVKISDCFIYLNKLSDLLMLPFKKCLHKKRGIISTLVKIARTRD